VSIKTKLLEGRGIDRNGSKTAEKLAIEILKFSGSQGPARHFHVQNLQIHTTLETF